MIRSEWQRRPVNHDEEAAIEWRGVPTREPDASSYSSSLPMWYSSTQASLIENACRFSPSTRKPIFV